MIGFGYWEVVVAQLVEWSLQKPEVRGLNPVIGKIWMYYQMYRKDENKVKEAGNGPIFSKKIWLFLMVLVSNIGDFEGYFVDKLFV